MVGPYAIHGDIVVEQAVEQGTHYTDLTGKWLLTSQESYQMVMETMGLVSDPCSPCTFSSHASQPRSLCAP